MQGKCLLVMFFGVWHRKAFAFQILFILGGGFGVVFNGKGVGWETRATKGRLEI